MESFSKRLINLLGMSQEDEPFLGGEGWGKGRTIQMGVCGCICMPLCVCVHMPALICVHFISMKTAHLKKKAQAAGPCVPEYFQK